MKLGVGLKWAAIAALVLGVGLISYFVIQYVQDTERDKINIELQEKQDDKIKKGKESISEPSYRSDSDVDSILREWESRQGHKKRGN